MNILTRSICITLLAVMIGCSDGSMVSQHIVSIVDARNGDKIGNNDLHVLSVEFAGELTTYKIDQDSNKIQSIVGEQFLMIDDLYVNLTGVRTIQVRNDTLTIAL